jgi:hypothetical protein
MYEFEFEIFKYNCNLYLPNGVSWHRPADIIDPFLVSAGLSYLTSKIDYLTPRRGSLVLVVL